jgi:hypothetical protein
MKIGIDLNKITKNGLYKMDYIVPITEEKVSIVILVELPNFKIIKQLQVSIKIPDELNTVRKVAYLRNDATFTPYFDTKLGKLLYE